MRGSWKEISRNQLALLKTSAPFLRPPRENYNSGLPNRSSSGVQITFDPVWYAHEYLDAAMEISEGWFEDPLHHYLEVGRLRGHRPTRPVGRSETIDPSLQNLALHKEASQSSLSPWSRGITLAEDAGTAVNGRPWEGDGFHTGQDDGPWWQVDLGKVAEIRSMRIFNRDRQPDWVQKRASPLLVEFSRDGAQWERLFATQAGHVFGGYSDGSPLIWSTDCPVMARFIRISIQRREVLHLSEVEVYGRGLD
jgi:hypothetical protein